MNNYSDIVKKLGFLIKDQSVLHAKHTWYKVGKKGQIHAKSDCGGGKTAPVVLTLEQSCRLRTCKLCWHYELPNILNVWDALKAINAICESIEQSELTLKAPSCDAILLGKVVEYTDLCKLKIGSLLDDTDVTARRDMQYVSALLEDTINNMHDKRDELNEYITEYAVTQNMVHYGYGTDQTTSACLDFMQTICGKQISWIYYSWCSERTKGVAAAAEAGVACFTKLNIVNSLTNVTEILEMYDLTNENLHDESVVQLHKLFEIWESIYTALVNESREQGDVLVGCDLPVVSPKAAGALLICKGQYGLRKQTSICLMPSSVAQWLQYGEFYGPRTDRFNVVTDNGNIETACLETLASLWDPNDKSSIYSDLHTALAASRSV